MDRLKRQPGSAARILPGRAMFVATLLGSLAGALITLGTVTAQEANVVTVNDFSFNPKELSVAVGTTVKWMNKDDVPHSVVDKGKTFRSKPFDTNESFSYTFASAGTFDYICGLHPQMTGKIIVK
jgi:plastocyanin